MIAWRKQKAGSQIGPGVGAGQAGERNLKKAATSFAQELKWSIDLNWYSTNGHLEKCGKMNQLMEVTPDRTEEKEFQTSIDKSSQYLIR